MRVIFMQLACQNFYNTTQCVIQMSFHGKFTQRNIFHYTKPGKPPPKQVKIIHTLSRPIDNPKYKMFNLKLPTTLPNTVTNTKSEMHSLKLLTMMPTTMLTMKPLLSPILCPILCKTY